MSNEFEGFENTPAPTLVFDDAPQPEEAAKATEAMETAKTETEARIESVATVAAQLAADVAAKKEQSEAAAAAAAAKETGSVSDDILSEEERLKEITDLPTDIHR